MKPNINRMTYCIGCRRPKMLFEEKKKADNFIRFNKDEIFEENGKAPVRSYYCAFCSGWHVTSNPSLEQGEEQDKRDMDIIESTISIKRDISSFTTTINQKITDIKRATTYPCLWFSIFQRSPHRCCNPSLSTYQQRRSNHHYIHRYRSL